MLTQLSNQFCRRANRTLWRSAFCDQSAYACGQPCGLLGVVRVVVRNIAHAVVWLVVRTQHGVGRLTGLSASARQLGCSARAEALWSNNHAVCCGRSQKNPHDRCSIHPQPFATAHSERSWAPRCSGLRSGPRRKLACERSAKAFPQRPAARTAPDWRPIPSLRSVISRPPVGRAARWTEAPHQSRLGALPPLALVGTRACFCRDRLSPRWGASFPLLRLGASHHGSPAWGACANFRSCRAQVFCHLSPVAGATCARLCARVRAKVLALRKRMGLRVLAQSKPNPHQTQDQSCSKCPSIVRQSSTKRQIKPR